MILLLLKIRPLVGHLSALIVWTRKGPAVSVAREPGKRGWSFPLEEKAYVKETDTEPPGLDRQDHSTN